MDRHSAPELLDQILTFNHRHLEDVLAKYVTAGVDGGHGGEYP
jgi:hypothetical protein